MTVKIKPLLELSVRAWNLMLSTLGQTPQNGLAPARVSFNPSRVCCLITSIQPWDFHYILHIARVQCNSNVLLQLLDKSKDSHNLLFYILQSYRPGIPK